MDPKTVQIIIDVVIPIFSGLGGVGIKTIIEDKQILNIRKDRRKGLKGNWEGHFYQNNDKLSGFEMELKVGIKRITGFGVITFNKGKVKFKGGYRNDRFLKLEYENTNNEIIQFGTIIFKFNSFSNTLIGEFTGYGPDSGKIISGTIEMKKVNYNG